MKSPFRTPEKLSRWGSNCRSASKLSSLKLKIKALEGEISRQNTARTDYTFSKNPQSFRSMNPQMPSLLTDRSREIQTDRYQYDQLNNQQSGAMSDRYFNRCKEWKFMYVNAGTQVCNNCLNKESCLACGGQVWIPRAGLCQRCLKEGWFSCSRCNEVQVFKKGDRCDACKGNKWPRCGRTVAIDGKVCIKWIEEENRKRLAKKPTCMKCGRVRVAQDGQIWAACGAPDKQCSYWGDMVHQLYKGICKKCANRAQYFCTRCQFEYVDRPGQICNICQPHTLRESKSAATISASPRPLKPEGRLYKCMVWFTRFRTSSKVPVCSGCKSIYRQCAYCDRLRPFSVDNHGDYWDICHAEFGPFKPSDRYKETSEKSFY